VGGRTGGGGLNTDSNDDDELPGTTPRKLASSLNMTSSGISASGRRAETLPAA